MAMLRPSSEMKDSGIEWIGEIPKDWKTAPLYSALTEINQKNSPVYTTNILSLTNTEGVIPYSERGNQGNKSKDNYEEYKVVYPNTIVANSMNILIGSVGLSAYEGCVSPVYYVYAAKPKYDIRYLNYLFQMELFQKRLRQFANGILEIRLRVSSHDILHQKVMMPSYTEQQAIADYLDDRCSKIDEIIADAEASIGEYKELKQAVITDAVTHGIARNTEMKNTDIFGGEEIPKHWKVIRLKNIVSKLYKGSGITKDDVVEEGNISCVRYGEIYTKYDYYFDVCVTKTELDRISSKRYFSTGDILFVGTGELVEEIGKNIAYLGDELCLAGGDIIVAKHNENPVFLSYALNSHYVQTQKSKGKAKLKVVHISSSEIGNLTVFLPPMEEQNEIAEYLVRKCSVIDSIIGEKQALIEDLQAYKKSLIYEVVTGKRRVV